MKRLFLDFLRRWAWFYLILGSSQLLILVLSHSSDRRLTEIPAFGLLPLLLMLSYGVNRVYHSLPVRKQTIQRLQWVIGVAIPTGIYAANLTVASLLRFHPGLDGAVLISQATLSIVLCFLWLGAVSPILLKSFPSFSRSESEKWTGGIIGLLGLLIGGYIITLLPHEWESLKPLDWVTILIGAILTATGWKQTSSVKKSLKPLPESTNRPLARKKNFQTNAKEGSGLFVLAKTVSGHCLFILLTAVGGLFFIGYLQKEAQMSWTAQIIDELKHPKWTFFILCSTCMFSLSWLSALRQFRVLPIRGRWFVAFMGTIFTTPLICGWLILFSSALLFSPQADLGEWMQVGAIEAAVVLILVTAILRFGNTIQSYSLLIPFLGIYAGLQFYLINNTVAGTIAFACLLWIGGCLSLKNSLLANAQTYRHKHTFGVPKRD